MKVMLMVLLSALTFGCATEGVAPVDDRSAQLPCYCGKVEADLFGCLCSSCRAGIGKASNDECICTPLPTPASPDSAEPDSREAYRLACATATRGDAAAQLELGRIAAELGMPARAREHFESSAVADATLLPRVEQELAALDAIVAARLLAEGQRSLEAGEEGAARMLFARVLTRYPHSAEAIAAAAALGAARERARTDRVSREDAWPAKIAAALTEVRAGRDRMLEYTHRGLMTVGSRPKAIANLDEALDQGEDARAKLAELLGEREQDPELVAAAARLAAELVDQLLFAGALLADICVEQGSYKTALAAAERSQRLAPADPRAWMTRSWVDRATR